MTRPDDRRHVRSRASREALLLACADLMMEGSFRPTMLQICAKADRSVRTGFAHFNEVDDIKTEVLGNPDVVRRVLDKLLEHAFPDKLVRGAFQLTFRREVVFAIVHAAVFGEQWRPRADGPI